MPEAVSPRTRDAIVQSMGSTLRALYGDEQSVTLLTRLLDLVQPYETGDATGEITLSERDIILITYGDQVRRVGQRPLVTLGQVLDQIAGPIRGLHILPFFPYSSDDGFSVIDYYEIDLALGTWDDIRALRDRFRLMFDAVFNHVSVQSAWFQAFLRGEPPFSDFFVTVDPSTDLSLVTRPRTVPLLTPFETAMGKQHVWTTFSPDQIDLNAANPQVLEALIRVLLFYVEQGAQLIRLDAIGFLWKEIGTTCIHLPQTHRIIRLMRDVLDLAAPGTLLVTETNVPHLENISYFGDGYNEAQMVYQFPLPPLILHTLHAGDATRLTQWASAIQRMSDRTTFFNFTASHDGIGVRPVTGILSDDEIAALIELTQTHGGFVSYKSNSDGTRSPYELNITYFDAITRPDVTTRQPEEAVARFMVSQAIMLAFLGVPGIYFHSLVGSRNDRQGAAITGRYRSINREKLDADALLAELAQPGSLRQRVYTEYMRLLTARTSEPAFHPLGRQTVLDAGPSVFAIERTSPDAASRVLALHNVRGEPAEIDIKVNNANGWIDLLDTNREYGANGSRLNLTLAPYQVAWLKAR